MSEKFIFDIIYSSPYHHQANGQIERQFCTVRDWLFCTLKDQLRKNWEDTLQHIEFASNVTTQKSIECSPTEIVFGKKDK